MKVVVLDQISEHMQILCREHLNERHEIVFVKTEDDYTKHISTAHVLVTFTHGVPQATIQQAEQCVFIQKLGAGVNNIDIEEATKRRIQVANAPGLNATSVAEHAVLLMSATYKHLVTAHNKIVQNGEWLKTGLRDQSYELTNKKVGLIGFGNIGRKVRKLLRGYDCEVYYHDVFRLPPDEEKNLGVEYLELDTLLETAEVVSVHVPLIPETYHLINETRLKKMKKTAVLINTCRGGVIDEDALYKVLKSGHLTGAGLDVFETEPVPRSHKLAQLPNVILTPHIGGGTVEAMEAVIRFSFENINQVLDTGKADHEQTVINRKDLSVSHS